MSSSMLPARLSSKISSLSSFRGALLREPGIHSPCVHVQHLTSPQGVWIPGLRQAAHPGMTRTMHEIYDVIKSAPEQELIRPHHRFRHRLGHQGFAELALLIARDGEADAEAIDGAQRHHALAWI